MKLSSDYKKRKQTPVGTGVLDYFPDAIAAVAEVSYLGNQQHNPGQPLHWERSKSTDHADCLIRHYLERGTIDVDGARHSAKVAWRALALLQLELEAVEKADKAQTSMCNSSVPDGTGHSTEEPADELVRQAIVSSRIVSTPLDAQTGSQQSQSNSKVPF